MSDFDTKDLEAKVKAMYRTVAETPKAEFHGSTFSFTLRCISFRALLKRSSSSFTGVARPGSDISAIVKYQRP